ncbi:MAG TPA: prolipoprotein diacylglyceryl transferase family protein [Polyangiaceae bacterium]|nr:prolipoprotein diacylglyceryl transferase family protein [Polyangiaceae bacterium]
MHIDERSCSWVYMATTVLALVIALLLPSARSKVPPDARRTYAVLQFITLAGALFGAKLAMLAGDLGWPVRAVDTEQLVFSGRSITGGLLGGFLAAEFAKPWLGWREPPNDWFATKLLLSIAIGRVGCVFAGCCRGIATDWPLYVAYSDGIPRVPVSALECGFHALLAVGFFMLYRAERCRGRLFAGYLVLYGIWRFAFEPLRETPKFLGGASVYQAIALLLVVAGSWSLTRPVALATSEVRT